ncbi:MAG: extracellular solute-binding protein [Clostridiales bacterium]|nr:extracellular solute-binding protein [Clostridiales bacterium]
MKKKRLLAIGLVAVMAASLAACGSSDSSSTTTDDTSSSAEAETSSSSSSSSSSGDVITYWNIATEGVDQEVMQYAVDQYNENDADTYGYTVEVTSIQNDNYKEKLVIAMSSGECPDMYSSWAGGPLQEYVESGYGVAVTDLVEEYGIDEILLESALSQGMIDGEVYGVTYKGISICGVFYNKTLFEELGLEEPTTLAELEEVCDTLLENGVTPFALGNSTKWQGSMFYQSLATRYAGLDEFRDAYDGSGTFESDGFIYAGNKILEWAEKGYFQEGCNGVSTDDGQDRQAIYQGTCAMLCSGSWYTATFQNDDADWYSENIGWFAFPQIEESDDAEGNYYLANGTVGDQFITFTCEGDKLEAAFKCYTYLLSDEAIQIGVDGGNIPPVEGVEDLVTDPVSQEIIAYVNECTDVQLWYDQYLPTEVANAHLDNSQLLFSNETTSEEVAAAEQEAMQDYLAE